jgi:uncharacterized protein
VTQTPPDEAEDLRATWSRLGLPGVIDVHTHFMPDNVMDKVWRYFDAAGPLLGRPWPITYRQDEQTRVDQLRAFGVLAFTSMVYPHKPDMAAWLNSWAVDFARRTPDCLQTATFFPEPSAAAYVPEAIERGARVFKAHVQVGAYDPVDPLLEPVWGALEDAGTPIVIHCGSGPMPGRFTGPGPIREVMRRHPRLRLVIAHLGLPEYSDFLDLTEAYDGVHLDTTMAFTDFTDSLAPFPADQTPRLVDVADRIVLGTDYPNIPYSYTHAIESLERLGLSDDWLRGVLYENPRRLFGLGAA